jgi:type VI secretion system secreted protein VgrG
MKLDANTTWFNFTTSSGQFEVYAFDGEEELCRPYSFSIELVNASTNLDINSFLGTEACLSIADQSGEARFVHGIIRSFEHLHSANSHTHYRCELVPRLRFLDDTVKHRIFQNLSVIEIIQRILKEFNFAGDCVEYKLGYSYEPREYCVQYGESDLYFITRLCEEEGIFFYFSHSGSGHVLTFSDREGGPKISGENPIRFYEGSGHSAETAVISRINLHQRVTANNITFREWNFTRPKLDLEVACKTQDPAASAMNLEHYQYPHNYQLSRPGNRYAKLEMLRYDTFAKWIEAETDAARFVPGFCFGVHSHKREEINSGWFITHVRHHGSQAGVLEEESPDGLGLEYRASITALPEAVRFVSIIAHPKRQVQGRHAAIVTGPEGEEIFTDEYGRVKVQFFWDRSDKWNENTTCWIRVSQGWAGCRYGELTMPRIGHEVIVSFMEGDPDRPLIVDRIFNARNIPPYKLPKHKTRTGFRSSSSLGGQGYNDIWFDDEAGKEMIHLHAQKDLNVHVNNDWKEHVLHDKKRTVEGAAYRQTGGETHETLNGARMTELFSSDNLTVHADSHTQIDDKWLEESLAAVHYYAGEKAVFDAGSEAVLRGGSNWLTLTGTGVMSSGITFGGGGSAPNVIKASPLLPDETKLPETGIRPTAPGLPTGQAKPETGIRPTAPELPEGQAKPVCLECLLAAAANDAPYAGSCTGNDC